MQNNKHRILVIDTEEINLDILHLVFKHLDNIELCEAYTGIKAIEIAQQEVFDTILLDAVMPDIDGMEILQQLRSLPKYKSTPILVITSNLDRKHEALELGATDFISKPFDVKEVKLRILNYLDYNRVLKLAHKNNLFLQEELENTISELEKALTISRESQYEIAYRLARASEFRDFETGMHLQRMSLYSKELAKLLNFSEEEQEIILKASPLHDVGKIGIPDKILLKPAKFTDEEFEQMKKHSQIGADILEGNDNFPILKYGKIIALEHHEKYDGSGYPYGKKGEEIHKFARIVAIADVFDALLSPRVYKKAMSLEKAISIMKEGRGKHFDPNFLDVFLEHLPNFLKIKDKYKDTL